MLHTGTVAVDHNSSVLNLLNLALPPAPVQLPLLLLLVPLSTLLSLLLR
jgi:hypothetical protein